MPEGARIYSTDALSIFRAALIKFAESGNVALSSADSDIDRVLGWLERDQTSYWAMQVRKRHAIVLQWEDAVRQKRLYKNVDGTTKSAVDEQKALQKANTRRGRSDSKNGCREEGHPGTSQRVDDVQGPGAAIGDLAPIRHTPGCA